MTKKRGKGMAIMYYPVGSTGKPNPGSAFIKINHDGTVTAFIGAVDEGQGSTTAMTQIIAEELGVEFNDIRLITADTELTPYDHGTGANRVTYIVGNAVKRAAEKAKKILLEAAAIKLDVVNPGNLVCEQGEIFLAGYPEKKVSIGEAAWASERERGIPILATASYTPSVGPLDPETGHGKAFETHVYATQIAEVEVDTETGEVEVLKLVAVHDCGKAINPMMVEGQIQGGVVMGLGYSLSEEVKEDLESANLLTPSFVDYKIFTIKDIPKEMLVGIVEEPEENGPFGAKGVAEPTQLPTAPAIINAIYDAVGVRIYDLPATAEKILAALNEKRRGHGGESTA